MAIFNSYVSHNQRVVMVILTNLVMVTLYN